MCNHVNEMYDCHIFVCYDFDGLYDVTYMCVMMLMGCMIVT